MKPQILAQHTIARTPGKFLGWPTIAATPWGELLVAFSGDRDAHICPFGKTQLVRSKDHGQTWSQIQTINNTPLDDRDAGLLCTLSGKLVLTWFTLDYSITGYIDELQPHRQQLYRPMYDKITPTDRQMWTTAGCIDSKYLRGHFSRTSDDRGITWGPAVRTAASAPHGPIELSDGRLLYVGNQSYERTHKTSWIVAEESRDAGLSWRVIGHIPMFTDTPAHLQPSYLCEPHVVEAADGTLVAAFRHEIQKKGQTHETNVAQGVLYFARSTDGGVTWTTPEPSGIVGKPPHLLKLPDGRLMASYGYRFKPPGQRVCISEDNGKTWPIHNTIILRQDGPTGDLGYTATAALPDGSLYTVYYQLLPGDEKQSILATHWRLP